MRTGHVAEFDVLLEGGRGDLQRPVGNGLEYAQLGAKCQASSSDAVEQWFLAQSIPRQHQVLMVFVPQREGKHASKPRHQFQSPALVAVEQDLGIAATAELVSQTVELRAQCLEVVDFAVE